MTPDDFKHRLSDLLEEAQKDIAVAWLVGILYAAAFHMLYNKE